MSDMVVNATPFTFDEDEIVLTPEEMAANDGWVQKLPDDELEPTALTYRNRLAFMLGNPFRDAGGRFASADSAGTSHEGSQELSRYYLKELPDGRWQVHDRKYEAEGDPYIRTMRSKADAQQKLAELDKKYGQKLSWLTVKAKLTGGEPPPIPERTRPEPPPRIDTGINIGAKVAISNQQIQVMAQVAKDMGFPERLISVQRYEREFTVNGQVYRSGGIYSSGRITMNAENIKNLRPSVLSGLLAHEITHDAWDQVFRQSGSGPSPEVAAFHSFLNEHRDQLTTEDGVTDYSRSYWMETNANSPGSRAHDQAINETMAEISRLDRARAGHDPTVSPVWRQAHEMLMGAYRAKKAQHG